MKEVLSKEFKIYLEKIGITTPIQTKCEKILSLMSEMTDEKIEDIYISDYISAGGVREYSSIWAFTKTYVLEAKQFITEINLDITPILDQIVYWSITAKDYDFKNTSEESIFTLSFGNATGINGQLKAVKNNCSYLKSIIDKYIKPNDYFGITS